MRSIDCGTITAAVERLCQEASFDLGEDVLRALKEALEREKSPLGKEALAQILENAGIARRERIPLCQDCGTAIIFLELGQEVHVTGGNLMDALSEGVKWGYARGYLRRSMVAGPLFGRRNTGDNTPPVVHIGIVPGDSLRVIVMPKGAGSENMSRLAMLQPAQGRKGIVDFVVRAVSEAGSSPCPPGIIGVGIGGTSDKAMWLAKEALLRPVGEPHRDPEVAGLEKEILGRVNALGIGPEGFGGTVTALAVHVEVFPTHIASLPVGVNIQCHSARHKEAVL
ncbi:MAG: fumarate hydratase [Chloroflexi bacterium]|nr:fumarate hydratase [Chloroflexota bacterium]